MMADVLSSEVLSYVGGIAVHFVSYGFLCGCLSWLAGYGFGFVSDVLRGGM